MLVNSVARRGSLWWELQKRARMVRDQITEERHDTELDRVRRGKIRGGEGVQGMRRGKLACISRRVGDVGGRAAVGGERTAAGSGREDWVGWQDRRETKFWEKIGLSRPEGGE